MPGRAKPVLRLLTQGNSVGVIARDRLSPSAKMSTSRYDLEDGTTAELAGLNTKLFDEHNKNGACRCAAVCLPHAEAVLRSLLLSDEDFHALYENERQSDG